MPPNPPPVCQRKSRRVNERNMWSLMGNLESCEQVIHDHQPARHGWLRFRGGDAVGSLSAGTQFTNMNSLLFKITRHALASPCCCAYLVSNSSSPGVGSCPRAN